MPNTAERLTIGDAAPNLELMNADGERLHISSLWQNKPILLSFLRHFG